MKQVSKKVISIGFVLLLLVAVLGVLPVAAEGEESPFTYEVVEGAVTITGYTAEMKSELIIPDTIEGCPVTAIAAKAFYGSKNVSIFRIPATVTAIGDNAFGSCFDMTAIEVAEDNPAYCDEEGILFNKDKTQLVRFPNNYAATVYTVPESVTAIETGAFSGCGRLREVHFPDSVTTIESSAFHFCPALTKVTLPTNLTTIAFGVFSGCSVLGSVTIPDGVTAIGNSAFSGCTSLTKVAIPNSVTTIGAYAFSSCDSLKTITIPDSVTAIGERAFLFCDSLTTVTMGTGVVTIANEVFVGCWELREVTLSESLTTIGEYAFHYCPALATLTIPAGVTKIGYGAFAGCDQLTEMVIPAGVKKIEDSLFRDCDRLTTITIPNTVTTIGHSAFANCDQLAEVYYDGTVTDKEALSIGDDNLPLITAEWHCKVEEPVEEQPVVIEPYEEEKTSWLEIAAYGAVIVATIVFLFVMFVRKPKY